MSSKNPSFSLFSPPHSHNPPCLFPSPSSVLPTQQTMPPTRDTLLANLLERLRLYNQRNPSTSYLLSFLQRRSQSDSSARVPTEYKLFPNYEQSGRRTFISQIHRQYETTRNLHHERFQILKQQESLKLLNLMTSEYGNNEFGNLFESTSDQGKIFAVQCLVHDKQTLMQIAKHGYGVNCLMMLVEAIKSTHLLGLVTSALREQVHELMIDPTASRLVRFCIEELSYEGNKFIFDAAADHFSILATNEIGSPLLKECLKNSKDREQERFLRKVYEDYLLLAKNSRGNLIVQAAVKLGNWRFNDVICYCLSKHLKELLYNQYGSYVLEECFKSSGREILLQELVRFARFRLERIVTDKYGNYVLQTAFRMSKDTHYHDQLLQLFRSLPKYLESDMHANKVMRLARQLR